MEYHKLNAITRKYTPNPIKIADRIPIINSFRINISKPIPTKIAPTFAIGFQDLLEFGLKYWLILKNFIIYWNQSGLNYNPLFNHYFQNILIRMITWRSNTIIATMVLMNSIVWLWRFNQSSILFLLLLIPYIKPSWISMVSITMKTL